MVGELRSRWTEGKRHVSRSDSTTRRTPEEVGSKTGDTKRRHSVSASDLKGL